MLAAFAPDKDVFVGKIIYKYSFTDLKGNDITSKVAPLLGYEQHYYINSENYKTYDEKNNWVQIYKSSDNTCYYFNKNKTAQKIDGATKTSEKFEVTPLNHTENIAGYDCQAMQVETDRTSTVYYFNSAVKTDVATFANGYIWTGTATEVAQQPLSSKDFNFLKYIKLLN